MGANFNDINSNLNTNNSSDIILDTELSAIDNSIKNIISTRKGELPGEPDFGTDLPGALFEELDDITFQLIEEIILEELDRLEPRIQVQNVVITTNSQEVVFADIQYTVLNLNDLQNNTTVRVDI